MRCSASVKTGRLGAFILVAAFCSAYAAESSEQIPLRIGKHLFEVEVATTPQQRERGLMQRTSLPANGGMLFVFEQPGRHCFWMRNTPLPLSIAFADTSGRIINLADMQPLTDTFHCASADARYALEVSQGGFQRRSIVPGNQIAGLPQ